MSDWIEVDDNRATHLVNCSKLLQVGLQKPPKNGDGLWRIHLLYGDIEDVLIFDHKPVAEATYALLKRALGVVE